MRILVLDGSRILPTLVRRLAPSELLVETAATFDEALTRLETDPPQAVIANLTPAHLPWHILRALCQKHQPPIPVLFESCVYQDSEDAGLGPLEEHDSFLAKPYRMEELRFQINRLVAFLQSGTGEPARLAAPQSRFR